jgi:esterase/lipase superfamily enzyme
VEFEKEDDGKQFLAKLKRTPTNKFEASAHDPFLTTKEYLILIKIFNLFYSGRIWKNAQIAYFEASAFNPLIDTIPPRHRRGYSRKYLS